MLNRLLTVDNIRLQSAGAEVSTFLPFDPSSRKLPKEVVIRATGNGAYVRLSDDRSAATDADMLVQPGDHAVVSVAHRRWVSVLAVSGSTTVSVGALSTGVGRSVADPNPFTQDGPVLDLVFAGVANDPLDVASTTDDTLELNFVAQAYQSAAQYAVWGWGTGGLQQVDFADIVTFTRASTATYFNSAGTLTSAAVDEARFDYNPSTLVPLGFLIEEPRTNSIRNNTMVGAVAGTPGTLPTNWTWSTGGAATYAVVGTGTENGITYIDIRFQGASAADTWNLIYDNSAAANGQSWTGSVYLKLAAGSTANIPLMQRMVFRDSGFANIQAIDSATLAPTTANLRTQRNTISLTATQAATVSLTFALNSATPTGAYDITLRIGLPQLELGAFATSVIPTTTTALTRSADVASVNTLSPWFNSTTGTIYAEYSRFGAANFQTAAIIGEPTFNNQYFSGFGSGAPSNNHRFDVTAGGVSQASITMLTAPALNIVSKTAAAYAVNDFAATANGAVPGTDTLGSLPSGMTLMSLGCNTGLSGGFLNGYIRRITYYPRRLSNADLQTITT